jgi:type IV pilus assembly protein PilE
MQKRKLELILISLGMKMRIMVKSKNQQGFTLIELMIVLVIIAILASIAYPSYQDSVRKARRSDAQAGMLQIVNYMERIYTEKNTYASVTIAASGVTSDYYTFTSPIPDLTATTYTLTAVPKGAQTDDSCGTLTLTQTGVKGADTAGCW